MRIDQMIRLCDRYDHSRAAQKTGMNTMLAIVCVQQGAEETPDEENKDEPPKEPRSPGVALVQQGGE